MNRHFLIFERGAHSVVHFVRAATITEAIRSYLAEQNSEIVFQSDGSLLEGKTRYEHLLAYVEAHYKVYDEWQIRELPEWAWLDAVAEVFCGESADGPLSIIDDCRPRFESRFPGVRARAFLWYLREGTLVTFYRKRANRLTILQRYLWNWDGHTLTVEEWHGGYEEITKALFLFPPRGIGALPDRTIAKGLQ